MFKLLAPASVNARSRQHQPNLPPQPRNGVLLRTKKSLKLCLCSETLKPDHPHMQARLTAVAVIVVVVDIVVHLVCARPELGIPPPIVRTSTTTASPAARPTAESPQLTAPLSHAPNSATPPPIAVTSAQWRGPRALPRCGPHTPGAWVGEQWPKTWVFDANACAYTVSTPFDFLAAFAGKRLLVVGDSVSRELAVDTMRVVAGCGTFEPLRNQMRVVGKIGQHINLFQCTNRRPIFGDDYALNLVTGHAHQCGKDIIINITADQ